MRTSPRCLEGRKHRATKPTTTDKSGKDIRQPDNYAKDGMLLENNCQHSFTKVFFASQAAFVALAKLGFGTAQLMGRVGRKQSLRLMEVAFAAGIRHFDTAPLYGLGAAEKMVGEFVADKRDKIIVATKFGIRPPARSAWMGMAKAGARVAVKAVPSLRVKLRRRAESMTARGAFTPEECLESLRSSLEQLRTERIDLFLMHEVLQQQINSGLLQCLEDAIQAGWIGRYGIATTAADAVAIAKTMAAGTVAQFPSSVFAPTVACIPGNFVKITHSAIGTDFRMLHKRLTASKAAQKRWSATLDLDCSDSNQLGRLFLYAAMIENAGGTVIFSSLNEERIRHNAALMVESPFSSEQVQLLWTLVKEEHWRRPQVC
jgi:D-threo-aldose 1-dehydrogenase